MSHIPPDKVLPQDQVDVWDHKPDPVRLRMHASDAKHALASNPDRYSLEPDKLTHHREPKVKASHHV